MQSGALMIVLYALTIYADGKGFSRDWGRCRNPDPFNDCPGVPYYCVLVLMLNFSGMNIYSVVYAEYFLCFCNLRLNAWAINRAIGYHQELRRTFIIPILVSGIMGLAAYGTYRLFAFICGVLFRQCLQFWWGLLYMWRCS